MHPLVARARVGGPYVFERTGKPIAPDPSIARPVTEPTYDGARFTDPWWAELVASGNPMLGGVTRFWWQDVPATGTARIDAVLSRMATRRAGDHRSIAGSALLEGVDASGLAERMTSWIEDDKARIKEGTDATAKYLRAAATYVGGPAFGASMDKAWRDMNAWIEKNVVGEGTSHPAGTRAAYAAAAENVDKIATDLAVWPPLNVLNVTAFGNSWEDSQLARDIATDIRGRFARMSASELAPIKASWAATLAHSKDPRLRDALVYSPWNAQGLADDTMVYLAALGPALAAGKDPRAVAIELWNTSRGLSDPLVASRVEHLEGSSTQSNAAEMLWAVLALDAWELVRPDLARFGVRKDPPKGSASLRPDLARFGVRKDPPKVPADGSTLLGVLGSIGLLALGAPTMVMLAPLAIVAASAVLSPSPKEKR